MAPSKQDSASVADDVSMTDAPIQHDVVSLQHPSERRIRIVGSINTQYAMDIVLLIIHSFRVRRIWLLRSSSRGRITPWGMRWGILLWRSMFPPPILAILYEIVLQYYKLQVLTDFLWIALTSNSAVTRSPILPKSLWTSESKHIVRPPNYTTCNKQALKDWNRGHS